jgi:hypothetical protein
VPSRLEADLAAVAARVGRRTAFRVEHHRLDFVGVCAACRPPTATGAVRRRATRS